MNFKILTYDGMAIDINGGPELKDFCTQLNNPALLTLALADEVLAKDTFKIIVPQGEIVGAYEIHTKDGEIFLTDIENYDANKISAQTNKQQGTFILIGQILIQKANIRRIKLAVVPA